MLSKHPLDYIPGANHRPVSLVARNARLVAAGTMLFSIGVSMAYGTFNLG